MGTFNRLSKGIEKRRGDIWATGYMLLQVLLSESLLDSVPPNMASTNLQGNSRSRSESRSTRLLELTYLNFLCCWMLLSSTLSSSLPSHFLSCSLSILLHPSPNVMFSFHAVLFLGSFPFPPLLYPSWNFWWKQVEIMEGNQKLVQICASFTEHIQFWPLFVELPQLREFLGPHWIQKSN